MKKCFVKYVDGGEEVFENASIEVTSKCYIIRRDQGEIVLAVAHSDAVRVAETPYPSPQQIIPGAGRAEIEAWINANAIPFEIPSSESPRQAIGN